MIDRWGGAGCSGCRRSIRRQVASWPASVGVALRPSRVSTTERGYAWPAGQKKSGLVAKATQPPGVERVTGCRAVEQIQASYSQRYTGQDIFNDSKGELAYMANERLTKLAGGMLRYRYAIDSSGEVAFDFNTLAEVGEPYQPWFREEIARRGWHVEFGRNLDETPYVADFVIGALAETADAQETPEQAEIRRLRGALAEIRFHAQPYDSDDRSSVMDSGWVRERIDEVLPPDVGATLLTELLAGQESDTGSLHRRPS